MNTTRRNMKLTKWLKDKKEELGYESIDKFYNEYLGYTKQFISMLKKGKDNGGTNFSPFVTAHLSIKLGVPKDDIYLLNLT